MLLTREMVEMSSLGLLGNILQNHWLEVGLVTCLEVFLLPVYDSLHCDVERVAALLHGLNIALCLLYLLLGIEQGFLLLPVHVLPVVAVGVDHVGERRRYLQVGNASVVDGECDMAVVVGVDDEVGCDLLQAASLGLSERGAGLGIEAW